VIVAVIAVRMMQPAVHEIVDVIAVRNGLVPAIWAVLVRAVGFRRTPHGIRRTDLDGMLIDVILMHVMKVAVVKIVHMAVMPDGGMPAIRAVLMRMVWMVLFGASHDLFPSFRRSMRTVRFPQHVLSRFARAAGHERPTAHSK
jgi:hypothetical protein